MSDLPPFFDSQNSALDFALDRDGAAIFARPGKGKTRVYLEWLKITLEHCTTETHTARGLVLAPLFPALTVWHPDKEAKKWGYDFDMRILHGKGKTVGDEQVSVLNYDGMPWALENLDLSTYDAIIYDESSKMKNPGTQRFRRWRRPVNKYFPYRLTGTGTPRGNKLQDLWGQMFITDLGKTLGSSVTRFRQRFFIPHPYIRGVWEPRADAEEEVYELMKPSAIALDRTEGELPGLHMLPVPIGLSAAARKVYEEMKKHAELEGTEVFAETAAVKSMKLRQLASGAVYDIDRKVHKVHNAKSVALRNTVDELQGEPILVFYEFDHSLAGLRNEFGDNLPVINGDTKPAEIIRLVDKWNTGAIPILAAHPATAGYGGNMQEAANNVAFYDMPWSLELIEQAIGRVWRTGQEREVMVHCLTVEDTKDEDVLAAYRNNKNAQDKLFQRLSV